MPPFPGYSDESVHHRPRDIILTIAYPHPIKLSLWQTLNFLKNNRLFMKTISFRE